MSLACPIHLQLRPTKLEVEVEIIDGTCTVVVALELFPCNNGIFQVSLAHYYSLTLGR